MTSRDFSDEESSLEILSKQIQADQRNSCELYLERGSLYMSLGRYDEALSDFTFAIEQEKTKEKKADLFFKRGDVFFTIGQYRKCIKDMSTSLGLGGGNSKSDVFNLRGLAYQQIQQYARSRIDFTSAIKNHPMGDGEEVTNESVAAYYYNRSRSLQMLDNKWLTYGDLSKCIDFYKSDPSKFLEDLKECRKERLNIYFKISYFGNITRRMRMNYAFDDIKFIIENNSNDEEDEKLTFEKQIILFFTKERKSSKYDFELSTTLLEKINDFLGSYSFESISLETKLEIRLQRVKTFFNREEYVEALQDLNFMVSKRTKNYYYFKNRGELYKSIEKYKESIRDFTKAIKLFENQFGENEEKLTDGIELRKSRAKVYSKCGKYEKAVEDYCHYFDILSCSDLIGKHVDYFEYVTEIKIKIRKESNSAFPELVKSKDEESAEKLKRLENMIAEIILRKFERNNAIEEVKNSAEFSENVRFRYSTAGWCLANIAVTRAHNLKRSNDYLNAAKYYRLTIDCHEIWYFHHFSDLASCYLLLKEFEKVKKVCLDALEKLEVESIFTEKKRREKKREAFFYLGLAYSDVKEDDDPDATALRFFYYRLAGRVSNPRLPKKYSGNNVVLDGGYTISHQREEKETPLYLVYFVLAHIAGYIYKDQQEMYKWNMRGLMELGSSNRILEEMMGKEFISDDKEERLRYIMGSGNLDDAKQSIEVKWKGEEEDEEEGEDQNNNNMEDEDKGKSSIFVPKYMVDVSSGKEEVDEGKIVLDNENTEKLDTWIVYKCLFGIDLTNEELSTFIIPLFVLFHKLGMARHIYVLCKLAGKLPVPELVRNFGKSVCLFESEQNVMLRGRRSIQYINEMLDEEDDSQDSDTGNMSMDFKSVMTLSLFNYMKEKTEEIESNRRFVKVLDGLGYFYKLKILEKTEISKHPYYFGQEENKDLIIGEYKSCDSFEKLFPLICKDLHRYVDTTIILRTSMKKEKERKKNEKSKEYANIKIASKKDELIYGRKYRIKHLHKEILVMKSTFFYRMFKFPLGIESVSELVEIEGLGKSSVDFLVEFIYTGSCSRLKSFNYQLLFEVLVHSEMYEEEEMKSKILFEISGKMMKEESKLLKILEIGHLFETLPEKTQTLLSESWSEGDEELSYNGMQDAIEYSKKTKNQANAYENKEKNLWGKIRKLKKEKNNLMNENKKLKEERKRKRDSEGEDSKRKRKRIRRK